MNKAQLKALIFERIAGQGNQVDLGGILPEALNNLLDSVGVEPLAYADLKAKRDAGELVVGALYRITDYVATTIQSGTRSANHPFDLVVTAVTEKELDAHAIAVPHEGDHYFDGFKLTAWDILYTLDNDDRYVWALTDKLVDADNNVYWRRPFLDKVDEGEKYFAYWDDSGNRIVYAKKEIKELETVQLYDTDFIEDAQIEVTAYVPSTGKGVIYHMVDEFGNERQFDFKGIQFLRDEAWCGNHSDWVDSVLDGTSKDWWFYALSWVDEDENVQDLSLVGNNGTLKSDEGRLIGCFDTKIGSVSAYAIYGIEGMFALDCNAMVSSHSYDAGNFFGTYGIQMKSECYGNTFGNDCSRATLGNSCDGATLGNYCNGATLGNDCSGATLGNDCNGATLGNYCFGCPLPDNSRYVNVLNGTHDKTITGITPNANYCQFVGLDSQGNVKVWNPADMVDVVGGVTIDLSEFDLATETDVTSSIPAGYVPKVGDKVITENSHTLMLLGQNEMYNGDIQVAFGVIEPEGESVGGYDFLILYYGALNNVWSAKYKDL